MKPNTWLKEPILFLEQNICQQNILVAYCVNVKLSWFKILFVDETEHNEVKTINTHTGRY